MKRMAYLMILFVIGCTNYQKSNDEEVKELKSQAKVYADSLFYKKEAEEFKWSDLTTIDENTKPLYTADDFPKNQIYDCLEVKSEILSVYYYSLFKDEGGVLALVLVVNTLESKYFVLVTTTNGSDIISCKTLTQNRCDVVNDHGDSEEIWCDEKEAYLTKSKNLQLTHIFKKEFDYGKYSTIEKDSITSVYTITDEGILDLIKSDSIRIEQ